MSKIVVQKGRRANADESWRRGEGGKPNDDHCWWRGVQEPLILADVICEQPLILEEILFIFISMIRPTRPQPRFYLHSRWFSEVGVACFQQSWERRILSVAFDVLPRKTRQIKNSEGVRHNGLSEIVTPVFWEDGFQITIVTFHCFGQNWFGSRIKQTNFVTFNILLVPAKLRF